MLATELLAPRSIAVVGGSNNTAKPGGKVLKNLIDNGFDGELYAVNPREKTVQGVPAYSEVAELPRVDLAILAIAAAHCPDAVETLAREKGTRGFIILSAGFSEESEEGAALEHRIVETVESVGGSLIGPNCIGVLNTHYSGVFTTPIPRLDPRGADFISGSGATAVFIMESGMPKGVRFAGVYSVGNSAQIGVEEVLAHLDETYDPATSSPIKLLYIESIAKPALFLEHARSLVAKGCRIAAIKAGTSEAGGRAASSHTGALAGSDTAVDALLAKAGVVRCYGREELISIASIFTYPPLGGRRLAVVTHAGGPAVMLTDALSEEGLEVPPIEGPLADRLKERLFAGSSVANPIDFLATGTAEQLGEILDACENEFDQVDAIAVIFGSPGLFDVSEVYRVLDEKMRSAGKPIYPVLPSIVNAAREIEGFLAYGRTAFFDEVVFARALGRVARTAVPSVPRSGAGGAPPIDRDRIARALATEPTADGYLPPRAVADLLDAAGIPRVAERTARSAEQARAAAAELGYPIVMKVVGPVHKSDVGGVTVGIKEEKTVVSETARMLAIPEASGVLLQPMKRGLELFAGAIREGEFGTVVLAGLGGVFVEVFADVVHLLAPFDAEEAERALSSLKGYPLLNGARGGEPIDVAAYAELLTRAAALVEATPAIVEMDLNPILATSSELVAVDARIRIAP